MSDFPNRLFIFPKKGVKKKDWKGRDNIIFSDLCAQTIPQNRYVAEREFININSIWHDASEEPKTGPACIVEIEIARQKYELKKQYLEEYPIQINDKVDCNEKACWVSNIRFTTL